MLGYAAYGFPANQPTLTAVTILDQDLRLLAAVPVPLAVFDRTGRLMGCTLAYATLTGLDPDWLQRRPSWGELVGRLRAQRQLPEVADPAAWRDAERRRLTGLTQSVEETLHLPDGRTLKRTATPLGEGGFILAYEDITERLEAARAANEATLVQRQTLDHLDDALAVFGSDGRLRFANAAFQVRFDDAPRLGDFLAAVALPWSVARALSRTIEHHRLTLPDGTLLDAHHVPLPDGATLLRFVDVTAGARLEDALRSAADASAEANRMKSEFVAILAEQAGQPLAAIQASAELLAGGHVGELTRRQGETAQSIAAAARRLNRLVSDVLDLAAIEAGIAPLAPAPFDLHDALATLTAAIAERARSARVKLAFDCPPAIGLYDGDQRRIRQAVLHLLSNAIAYTPAGGVVSLSAKRTSTGIDITVADTGVGIARADLPRVQEPFVRGTDAQADGAGLGLTLVRRFVELHGGCVSVSSIRNRGTTVVLHLPVAAPNG